MLHKNAAAGDIHTIANWLVADTAARNALAVTAADLHKFCYQADTMSYYVLTDESPVTWTLVSFRQKALFVVAASDETTAITAGTAKITFRLPAMLLTAIRASLSTAQVDGAIFTVDVNKNGATILPTKLTIDNTEKTSLTAATPPVLSASPVVIADDDEITIDVDAIGDSTAKGLKLTFIGTWE